VKREMEKIPHLTCLPFKKANGAANGSEKSEIA